MIDTTGLPGIVETSSDFDPACVAGQEGLFNKNMLTTAGVLVAAGTGVAGGGLLLSAFPMELIGASALSGGLLYAGDRQAKGLPIVPGQAPAKAAEA